MKDVVRGACDMLGYDVFQVANEGKMVCIVPAEQAEAALAAMKANNTAPMPPLSAASKKPTRPAVQGFPGNGLRQAPHPRHARGRTASAHLLITRNGGRENILLPFFLRPHPPLHHVTSIEQAIISS